MLQPATLIQGLVLWYKGGIIVLLNANLERMNPILNISMWVSLPNEVRYKIRSIFNIPRSSNTVVSDGRIETDGTTNEDFKHLTIDKMQEYLKSDSKNFHELFDLVVARVTDELANPVKMVISAMITPDMIKPGATIVIPVEPKKRGRPAKSQNNG